MSAEAIAKLRAEMDGAKDNAYVQFVGQYLLNHIAENPEDAARIMAADKTIAKSLDAMRSAAEKKKKGNMAMLTPDEGFAVVMTYYGIRKQPAAAQPVSPSPTAPAGSVAKPIAPAASVADFDLKLEDFGL